MSRSPSRKPTALCTTCQPTRSYKTAAQLRNILFPLGATTYLSKHGKSSSGSNIKITPRAFIYFLIKYYIPADEVVCSYFVV